MRKQQKRSEATHPSDGPVVPPQDISERDILCGWVQSTITMCAIIPPQFRGDWHSEAKPWTNFVLFFFTLILPFFPRRKDKQCIDHPGSKHFKAVIDTYAERYSHCISKYQKMVLTKEIYEKMSNQSSRFLKQQQDGSWTVISVAHIRDKIGQLLTVRYRYLFYP